MVEPGQANSMTTNQWAKKWFQQLIQGVWQFRFCDNSSSILSLFIPLHCAVCIYVFLFAKRYSMQETEICCWLCPLQNKMHYLSKLWQSSELSTTYACYVVCTKTFTNIVSLVIWIMHTQCEVDIESFATQLQYIRTTYLTIPSLACLTYFRVDAVITTMCVTLGSLYLRPLKLLLGRL